MTKPPFESYREPPQIVEPDDGIVALDTRYLSRAETEARYRRFVDSVVEIYAACEADYWALDERDKEGQKECAFDMARHLLAEKILREPGVLRYRLIREGPGTLRPPRMEYRFTVHFIRDPAVRDCFTEQMERERKNARIEGAEAAIKAAMDFITSWGRLMDPSRIQRSDALRGAREALSKVHRDNAP